MEYWLDSWMIGGSDATGYGMVDGGREILCAARRGGAVRGGKVFGGFAHSLRRPEGKLRTVHVHR